MKKVWFDEAWEDFEYWTQQDKKTMKKILQLLKDVDRNGYEGIGKPEPLKGELTGFWSRRIDDTNRLVYRRGDKTLEILSCRGHYDDYLKRFSFRGRSKTGRPFLMPKIRRWSRFST